MTRLDHDDRKDGTDESPVPDLLSLRPSPRPGQQWSFTEMRHTAFETFARVQAGEVCYHAADRSGDWFKALIGNYPPEAKSGDGHVKAPALRNLGLYFWYIPPWYDDDQLPHKEDEAYFVVDGRGRLCVSGQTKKVERGDLIFVPRCAPHKFFTPYGEGLTLLVIFSPAYSGAVKPQKAKEPGRTELSRSKPCENEPCTDKDYEEKSRAFVKRLVEKYETRTGDPCS